MNALTQLDICEGASEAQGYTRGTLISLALCCFLTATACGGSSSTSSQSESRQSNSSTAQSKAPQAEIDTCALVTKADAESILGESAQVSKEYGDGCEAYENVDRQSGRRVYLLVAIQTDAKEAFEGHKGTTGIAQKDGSQIQPLSGIGDQAYLRGGFRGDFLGRTTLSALKNDIWILLEVVGAPKKGSEEALKSVAKRVADAL